MNRIDVFVQGMDDHIGHLWWEGKHKKKWLGWEDLSVSPGGSPGLEVIRGFISQPPAVASWAWGRLDVFFAAYTGLQATAPPELVRIWWDGSNEWDGLNPPTHHWSSFDQLGGQFYDNPTAVASGAPNSNRIDVFVRGKDDHLGHLWWS